MRFITQRNNVKHKINVQRHRQSFLQPQVDLGVDQLKPARPESVSWVFVGLWLNRLAENCSPRIDHKGCSATVNNFLRFRKTNSSSTSVYIQYTSPTASTAEMKSGTGTSSNRGNLKACNV